MANRNNEQKKNNSSSVLKRAPGLIILPFLLSAFGLFFVYEASSIFSLESYGDSFHFLRLQAVWLAASTVAFIFFSFFNYKILFKFSVVMMLVTIGLLLAVLVIGKEINGAKGWIDLGPFNLQPTEFAKLSIIIYLSSWFVQKENKRFISFFVLLSLLLFLIILQPDVGSAIVIFLLSSCIYFLAGKDWYKLLIFVPLGGLAFFMLIKAAPYRLNRLLAFMNPDQDPLGVSYHINQILISLASGGFFGKGFGASRQKFLFLPEAHTDSIFAIIGEEFGFVGASIIVIAFIALLYMLYKVYVTTTEPFGKLLSGGIFIYFALQALVNLGGMVALMPLTGVPLPFISYGGSHLIPSFALLGIVVNILRNQSTTSAVKTTGKVSGKKHSVRK